jgi:hypothetical protein
MYRSAEPLAQPRSALFASHALDAATDWPQPSTYLPSRYGPSAEPQHLNSTANLELFTHYLALYSVIHRESIMTTKELRLLALDGGGVRGLSALMILEQLMEAVNPDSPPKPCDYFDMIGGTSTGG